MSQNITLDEIDSFIQKNDKELYASPLSYNAEMINCLLQEIIVEGQRYIYKVSSCDMFLNYTDITKMSLKELKEIDSFSFEHQIRLDLDENEGFVVDEENTEYEDLEDLKDSNVLKMIKTVLEQEEF
jgi:hypothetical protein